MDIAAFVVMPDHWHLLFAPMDPLDIASWMRMAMRWIARCTNAELQSYGCEWQEGYYDTFIRSGRQFSYVFNYIEANPVRAGLVTHPEEWEWSSAHPRWREILRRPWPGVFEKD